MITTDEIHAFVIGFFEVLPPWKPHYPMPLEYPSPLKGEYHYYRPGRGAGFIALLLVLIGLAKLGKEVLL
ncbi:hypothetical protein ES708_02380 [subsurface metagenome]